MDLRRLPPVVRDRVDGRRPAGRASDRRRTRRGASSDGQPDPDRPLPVRRWRSGRHPDRHVRERWPAALASRAGRADDLRHGSPTGGWVRGRGVENQNARTGEVRRDRSGPGMPRRVMSERRADPDRHAESHRGRRIESGRGSGTHPGTEAGTGRVRLVGRRARIERYENQLGSAVVTMRPLRRSTPPPATDRRPAPQERRERPPATPTPTGRLGRVGHPRPSMQRDRGDKSNPMSNQPSPRPRRGTRPTARRTRREDA